jgi:hypothetical protein
MDGVRTAAIYHANGSSVGIAKIEGGWQYKAMMRKQKWLLPINEEAQPGSLRHGLDDIVASSRIFSADSLRDWMPPWLGGEKGPGPEFTSLVTMILALKTATETWSEAKATEYLVSFPARPSGELLRALDAASKKLSLHMPILMRNPAGEMAAYANAIGDNICYPGQPVPGEQLVLTVEYSRAGHTMMLWSEDCGDYDLLRGHHNSSLGTRAWGSPGYRKAFLSDLAQIIRLPVQTPLGNFLDKIGALVTYGEAGGDQRLADILKDAFAGLESSPIRITAFEADHRLVDPLFAPAIGTAKACMFWSEEERRARRVYEPTPREQVLELR